MCMGVGVYLSGDISRWTCWNDRRHGSQSTPLTTARLSVRAQIGPLARRISVGPGGGGKCRATVSPSQELIIVARATEGLRFRWEKGSVALHTYHKNWILICGLHPYPTDRKSACWITVCVVVARLEPGCGGEADGPGWSMSVCLKSLNMVPCGWIMLSSRKTNTSRIATGSGLSPPSRQRDSFPRLWFIPIVIDRGGNVYWCSSRSLGLYQ